ncbi:hypothetical protein HPC49_14935 [Pyxidicoccus fallax]|uniref:Uncharacterized protein n=1 Tax=Pyxidicoccus fallax TaxID=394095 RepID=A0A848L6P8_9BACT|nr:hypothetical protein [Pyxidicoccus fallax]NMO14640.1 hypothetical protein [Pyxidicoccus fallax]NPC79527.1 hypothetical protein [Pyxidicoccus fallax]
MEKPTPGAIHEALERAVAALEAAATPELLIASAAELRPVASPYAAALVLSSLAADTRRLERAARPFLRYLLETREPSGLWRLWTPSPEQPPGTSASARASLSLALWGVAEADPAATLRALLATAHPDGGLGTWAEPARADAEDLLASVDVLALASAGGHALPALTARVGSWVEMHGLEGRPRQPFTVSPFALAHALTTWLRTDDTLVLRRIVWRDCAQRRRTALKDAYDCALALSTVLTLGPPRGEPSWEERVEEMVARILQAQSDVGLWPALALMTDAHGRVYGSLQVTTAACIEALTRYTQWREGTGLPGKQEPAPLPPRGWRAATARKARSVQDAFRPGTWSDTLAALHALVPPTLLSTEAMERVRDIARWLPSELTHGFGLECRLAEVAPRADVFFWLNSDSYGPYILAGEDPKVSMPEALRHEPLWRSIFDFSRQWTDPGSLLHQGVDSFWLEFDVGDAPAEPPVPVIFFCHEERPIPEDTAGARACRQRHQDIATAALHTLSDGGLSPETLHNVRACIEALPPGSQPFALGVLRSRRLDTVRFCAKDIPAEGMLDYLASVGWSGPRAELQELLGWLAGHVDRFVLDFDVGAHVLPTVGLECSFHGRRQPSAEPRWAVLLEELVRRGLCQHDKRDALLAWPGQSPCVEHLEGAVRESRFDRRLSHLKLSLKPELEAKGYFGAWRYLEMSRPP